MKRPAPAKTLTKPHDYRLVERRMVCAECGAPMSDTVPVCTGPGANARAEQQRQDKLRMKERG